MNIFLELLSFIAYFLPVVGWLYLFIFHYSNRFARFHMRQAIGLLLLIILLTVAWAGAAWLLAWVPSNYGQAIDNASLYIYYIIVFITNYSPYSKIMEASIEFLIDQLKSKGIRPSYQRMKVLEYLYQIGGHPTIEEIFCALSPVIPSLSKVTIYNTLNAFVKAGLARVVEIDDAQMRYDISLEDHGHFLCETCGMIYNFAVSIDPASIEGLSQFKIMQKNVYFKGICPNCVDQQISPKKE